MCYSCKDSRKSINILGKIPDSIGNLQVLLVWYTKIQLFLYGNQNENTMDTKRIKELINSQEPIAIVRFFEWPVFSKSDANSKYVLLKVSRNRVKEIDIPEDTVSFLRSKLSSFDQVFHREDGAVWERMSFRDRVKDLVPESKVIELVDKW